jgi:hypothetical protein
MYKNDVGVDLYKLRLAITTKTPVFESCIIGMYRVLTNPSYDTIYTVYGGFRTPCRNPIDPYIIRKLQT